MSAPYSGNPTSAESPSLPPGPGVTPIVTIPADPDGASWANIGQLSRVPVDWTAYFNGARWTRVQELYNFPNATIGSSQAPVTNAPQMSAIVGGSGSVTIQDPGVGTTPYLGKTALLTVGPSGSQAGLYSSSKIAPFASPSSLRFVYEADVAFTNAGAANNSQLFGVSDTNNLTGNNFCVLINNAGAWNVFYTANAGAYTFLNPVSPAMTPADNTFQRIRICLYGTATPEGVAAGGKNVLLCFINDTQVFASNPTFALAANCFVLNYGLGHNAPVGNAILGSWFYNWNRY